MKTKHFWTWHKKLEVLLLFFICITLGYYYFIKTWSYETTLLKMEILRENQP